MANAANEIREALEARRPEDAIARVKDVVRDELRALDPSAEIEETQFFNHSFAPDFVLTWRTSRRQRARREVYLRPSVFSSVSSRELEVLQALSPEAKESPPMVVALGREANDGVLDLARTASARQPRVLLTDIEVIEEFAERGRGDLASPVQQLVRANVAKGGRGILLEDEAAALMEHDEKVAEPAEDQRFLGLVRESFDEEVATSIVRTSQIIAMARTGDLELLEAEFGEHAEAVGGRLSRQELQLVLPYILKMDAPTTEPRFWRHLGGMLTLSDLEEMSSYLAGVDLTSLALANLSSWHGTRAAVALYLPDDEIDKERQALSEALSKLAEKPTSKRAAKHVEQAEEAVARRGQLQDPRGRWLMHANMLSTAVGDWRVHIGANGSRLKVQHGTSARLDAIAHLLPDFDIAGVGVDGAERSFALTSSRTTEDIAAFTSTVADDYHVRSIDLTAVESESVIEVSYRDALVTSNKPATVRELGRAAVLLLGYRRPVSPEELAHVLPPAAS